MAIVVVRYTQEATNQTYILAQDADGDANTLHDAFEEYLSEGWTTEILAYHPRADGYDYYEMEKYEHHEEEAHR